MKTIKTIILSFACLAMASCDFLDKEPTKLTPDNYFNNAEEALSFPDLCIRSTDLTELLRKRVYVHDGCRRFVPLRWRS